MQGRKKEREAERAEEMMMMMTMAAAAAMPPGPGTAAGDTKMDRVASVSGCMDAWMGPKATTGGKSYGGGDDIASLMEGEIVGNVHSFISFAGGGEDTDSCLC